MSKELEALEYLNCLERLHDCGVFNYEEMEDYNTIKQAILELQSIKEANPSEALECLENIGNWELANSCMETVNESDEFNTIKQALLKAQEQEKENELLKGQMKYVTVVITEFQKILRTIKEKCLTNCNLALVKDNLHYQNYCKEFEYFLNKYNESPNGFEIIKEDLLTEEEFNLLKEVLE